MRDDVTDRCLSAPAAATELGRCVDPDDSQGALECVVRGTASVLAPGWVLVLAAEISADFDEAGGPVPNLVHRVTEFVEDHVSDRWLGTPVVTVGRGRQRHHDGEWLQPEAVHLLLYRSVA
jgi:hypothetical protein